MSLTIYYVGYFAAIIRIAFTFIMCVHLDVQSYDKFKNTIAKQTKNYIFSSFNITNMHTFCEYNCIDNTRRLFSIVFYVNVLFVRPKAVYK